MSTESLIAERDAALARAEKAEIQLARCGAAALGWSGDCNVGDYGWSASYGDVVSLRRRFEQIESVLRALLEALPKCVQCGAPATHDVDDTPMCGDDVMEDDAYQLDYEPALRAALALTAGKSGRLACSCCGAEIPYSYAPGRCFNEQCEPQEMQSHDEAELWEVIHGDKGKSGGGEER